MTYQSQEATPVVRRVWEKVKTRRRSIEVLFLVLVGVLILDILTFTAGFGSNDDPATYTDQAWAVLYQGSLAHYTYWYDHPPAGWLQIASYAWLTDGFERSQIDSLMAGELMVIAQLVSCALIFMLMRRLNYNRVFAVAAVVLFAVSPLAVFFQKMAFLDNLAITWVLAAMVFAASPRQSLASAFGAGLCLSVATLTKETAAIWFIAVLYLLWRNHLKKNQRGWSVGLFVTTYVLIGSLYILFAALKGELIPGEGHVSLWDALVWQLTRPAGGGDAADGWLSLDRWMLYSGAVAAGLGVFVRQLRPFVLAFALPVATVARGGYVPPPFVIGMLPFAALLVAGVLGSMWQYRAKLRESRRFFVVARKCLVIALAVAGIAMPAPGWVQASQNAVSRAEVVAYEDSLAWVQKNVAKDAVIAVDNNAWIELTQLGYKNPVWFYKLDLDPAVRDKYVPNGYQGIDYIVLKRFYTYIAKDLTSNSVISQAINNGELVAEFSASGITTSEQVANAYVVYRVKK